MRKKTAKKYKRLKKGTGLRRIISNMFTRKNSPIQTNRLPTTELSPINRPSPTTLRRQRKARITATNNRRNQSRDIKNEARVNARDNITRLREEYIRKKKSGNYDADELRQKLDAAIALENDIKKSVRRSVRWSTPDHI